MAQVGSIRGLSQYIKKIRAATTQEERESIVHKELAKIREKYSSAKKASAYDRKKYTWKLLYSHMMGFQVDFGHKQAADLIPSTKFDEKQVGYQALTILLNENDEFMMLPINHVLKDLESDNELFISLALTFAGTVAGPEMAAAISQPVTNLLTNLRLSEYIRKKASLCMLRVISKLPPEAVLTEPEWPNRLFDLLSRSYSIGSQLAVMGLITGVLERDAAAFISLQTLFVQNLFNVVNGKTVTKDYMYYGIPSPWLQCRYLRALAHLGVPSDSALKEKLMGSVLHILNQPMPSGRANQNLTYARTAILAEASQLCIHLDSAKLLNICLQKLTGFLERRDANVRYVALQTLCKLAQSSDALAALKPHIPLVSTCLSDPDPGVKKCSVNLLCALCDSDTAESVVAQLLDHVPLAEGSVREDLVSKVAQLSEKYAPSTDWFVITILSLMDMAPEEMGDDVWQRLVHIVTNIPHMVQKCIDTILERLQAGSTSIPLINAAGYVLAEWSHQIPKQPPARVAEELLERYALMPYDTRALLLTSLLKIRMHAPDDKDLQSLAEAFFEEQATSQDTELQQRAIEYLAMSRMAGDPALAKVLEPMPMWVDRGALPLGASTTSTIPVNAAAAKLPLSLKQNGDAALPGVAEEPAQEQEADVEGVQPDTATEDTVDAAEEVQASETAAAPRAGDQEGPASAHAETGEDNLINLFTPGREARGTEPAAADTQIATSASLTAPAPATQLSAPAAAPVVAPDPLPPPGAHAYQVTGPNSQGSSSSLPRQTSGAAAPAPRTLASSDWLRMLYQSKGVLMEDLQLQVGLVSQGVGGTRALTLFCGNKHETQALENLSMRFYAAPVFQIQIGPVPAVLMPMQQIQIGVMASLSLMESAAVNPTPPLLTVTYSIGGAACAYEVMLPVVLPVFLTPSSTITPHVFFGAWKQYGSDAGCYAAEGLRLPTPVPSGQVLASYMLQIGFSNGGVQLDPTSSMNFAGAATLAFMQVLARVEVSPVDATQVHVTVVVSHHGYASVLKDWVVSGISYMCQAF